MRQITLLRIVIKHTLKQMGTTKTHICMANATMKLELEQRPLGPPTTAHPPTLSGEKLSPIHGPIFSVYVTSIKRGKLLADLGVVPPMGANSFIFTKKHPCQRSTPPPPQQVDALPMGNPGSATGSRA